MRRAFEGSDDEECFLWATSNDLPQHAAEATDSEWLLVGAPETHFPGNYLRILIEMRRSFKGRAADYAWDGGLLLTHVTGVCRSDFFRYAAGLFLMSSRTLYLMHASPL